MIISSPVFRDITEEEIQEFVSMNAMHQRLFMKGEIILHMTGRYNSIFGYDNSIINELPHIEGIRFVAGFLNTPIKKDRNKSKNENKSIDRKI